VCVCTYVWFTVRHLASYCVVLVPPVVFRGKRCWRKDGAGGGVVRVAVCGDDEVKCVDLGGAWGVDFPRRFQYSVIVSVSMKPE
jgi:hypothetical protein